MQPVGSVPSDSGVLAQDTHAHIEQQPEPLMKTERVTLLTSPDFKAFLGAEAAREGVSVAELVRSRCERKPDADEVMLASLVEDLRKAVHEAQVSLRGGLAEADAVLTELRARRHTVDEVAGLDETAREGRTAAVRPPT